MHIRFAKIVWSFGIALSLIVLPKAVAAEKPSIAILPIRDDSGQLSEGSVDYASARIRRQFRQTGEFAVIDPARLKRVRRTRQSGTDTNEASCRSRACILDVADRLSASVLVKPVTSLARECRFSLTIFHVEDEIVLGRTSIDFRCDDTQLVRASDKVVDHWRHHWARQPRRWLYCPDRTIEDAFGCCRGQRLSSEGHCSGTPRCPTGETWSRIFRRCLRVPESNDEDGFTAPSSAPLKPSRFEIPTVMKDGQRRVSECKRHSNTEAREGTVYVAFRIRPSGDVIGATIETPEFWNTALGRCLRRVVRSLRFPTSQLGIRVKYPLRLEDD